MGTIALWIYIVGTLIAWPLISRYVLRGEGINPTGSDYAEVVALGMCIAPFWPVMVPGFWIVEWLRREKI